MKNRIIFKVRFIISIVGYISALIALLLLVVLATNWQIDEPNEIYSVIGLFLFYFLLGVYLVLVSLKYKLIVSDTNLTQIYPFKKTVTLNWTDIESINFRISIGTIIIHGNNNKIKLSRAIGNINKAFNLILEKVRKDKIIFDT